MIRINHGDDQTCVFNRVSSQKLKLSLDSLTQRSKEFVIPMPKISSGKYNILWRALSPDGHIIKGKSEFEVK